MTREIDRLRYDRLRYVALNVTNPQNSADFYEHVVGMRPAGNGPNGEPLLRCSAGHHDIMLCKGNKPGLKRLGWLLESEAAFSFALSHLRALGIDVRPVDDKEANALGLTAAIRFVEPTTGAMFEFAWGERRADTAFAPLHTKIARLGHVVLSSTDRIASEAFLVENLNFRVSDRIEKTVSFMRCFPNPFHHSLGVSQGKVRALNHINFMVTEIDDIGKAIYRMQKNNVKVVFGPGKHPPSESIFFYFLDPDNLTLEYSFGMEEFGEQDARAPRQMPQSLESIDHWGGMPAPEFGAVGAIEGT